jgi:hypothetical protein
MLAGCSRALKNKGWQSAALNGVQVVVGSNPTGPTRDNKGFRRFPLSLLLVVAFPLPPASSGHSPPSGVRVGEVISMPS